MIERRDSDLVTKASTEDELDNAKAECSATKLANDEYRRVLRTKNTELAHLKRETESLTKAQSLRIKELELVASQDGRRLAAL